MRLAQAHLGQTLQANHLAGSVKLTSHNRQAQADLLNLSQHNQQTAQPQFGNKFAYFLAPFALVAALFFNSCSKDEALELNKEGTEQFQKGKTTPLTFKTQSDSTTVEPTSLDTLTASLGGVLVQSVNDKGFKVSIQKMMQMNYQRLGLSMPPNLDDLGINKNDIDWLIANINKADPSLNDVEAVSAARTFEALFNAALSQKNAELAKKGQGPVETMTFGEIKALAKKNQTVPFMYQGAFSQVDANGNYQDFTGNQILSGEDLGLLSVATGKVEINGNMRSVYLNGIPLITHNKEGYTTAVENGLQAHFLKNNPGKALPKTDSLVVNETILKDLRDNAKTYASEFNFKLWNFKDWAVRLEALLPKIREELGLPEGADVSFAQLRQIARKNRVLAGGGQFEEGSVYGATSSNIITEADFAKNPITPKSINEFLQHERGINNYLPGDVINGNGEKLLQNFINQLN